MFCNRYSLLLVFVLQLEVWKNLVLGLIEAVKLSGFEVFGVLLEEEPSIVLCICLCLSIHFCSGLNLHL